MVLVRWGGGGIVYTRIFLAFAVWYFYGQQDFGSMTAHNIYRKKICLALTSYSERPLGQFFLKS